jgi:hypothetical protein
MTKNNIDKAIPDGGLIIGSRNTKTIFGDVKAEFVPISLLGTKMKVLYIDNTQNDKSITISVEDISNA